MSLAKNNASRATNFRVGAPRGPSDCRLHRFAHCIEDFGLSIFKRAVDARSCSGPVATATELLRQLRAIHTAPTAETELEISGRLFHQDYRTMRSVPKFVARLAW